MLALWTAVTLLPAVGDRVLEGVAGDPLGRRAGDDLDALGGILADHVLDAGVEVLGVLADDDQVDVVVAEVEALHRAGRAHVGVQVERLAERDVDAPEPATDRGRDRTLERDVVAPDGVEDVVRERRPVLLDRGLAGDDRLPFEADAGRIEHAGGRLRQLRTDAVAGDQGDSVGHAAILATRTGRRRPARPRRAGRSEVSRGEAARRRACRSRRRSP